MTTLHIDPSELYPRETRPLPPKPGASPREWAEYRGQTVKLTHRSEIRVTETKRKRKSPVIVDEALRERVRVLSDQMPDGKIATELNIHPDTVSKIRRQLGIKAKFARLKGQWYAPVPAWVPPQYAAEWRYRVNRRGGANAEKWVRCRMMGLPIPGPKPGEMTSRHTLLFRRVVAECARWFKVSEQSILGMPRDRDIATPRHIAIGLVRALTGRGTPWIGERFSGRDHATIIHSLRRFSEIEASSPKMADAIAEIRSRALSNS